MTQNSGMIGSRNRGSSLGSDRRNSTAAGNTSEAGGHIPPVEQPADEIPDDRHSRTAYPNPMPPATTRDSSDPPPSIDNGAAPAGGNSTSPSGNT